VALDADAAVLAADVAQTRYLAKNRPESLALEKSLPFFYGFQYLFAF
jgi:hypothetical protein